MKPYTSRAGCSRFARAAARRAPATGSRPGLTAPRPPRLPRVRHGKPRKPPVPRRPATCRPAPPRPPRGLCAPHAAKPARARLPAAARKEGSGSPRPGSARRAPAQRLAPAAPAKTARAAPAEAHRRQCAAARLTPAQTARAVPAAFRCAPKGDRILGLYRLETAAHSRVNFRKIQGWGY